MAEAADSPRAAAAQLPPSPAELGTDLLVSNVADDLLDETFDLGASKDEDPPPPAAAPVGYGLSDFSRSVWRL